MNTFVLRRVCTTLGKSLPDELQVSERCSNFIAKEHAIEYITAKSARSFTLLALPDLQALVISKHLGLIWNPVAQTMPCQLSLTTPYLAP